MYTDLRSFYLSMPVTKDFFTHINRVRKCHFSFKILFIGFSLTCEPCFSPCKVLLKQIHTTL